MDTEEPVGLQSMESQRVGHFHFQDLLSLFALVVYVSLTEKDSINITTLLLLHPTKLPIVAHPVHASVQFSYVAQSCSTRCNPMNRSTPGLPVHHQLLEFTQTHVHRVGDAIQPSHPLSSPSPPAPNPSQHQSLFQ